MAAEVDCTILKDYSLFLEVTKVFALKGKELRTVELMAGGVARVRLSETVIPAAEVSSVVLLVALTCCGTVVLKQTAVPP